MRIGTGPAARGEAYGKPAEAADAKMAALRRATRDFEAIFIKQMLSSARSGTPGESLFGPDVASEIMWNMQDQSLAESIARSRGIGLAGILERQLGESLKDRTTAADRSGAAEGTGS